MQVDELFKYRESIIENSIRADVQFAGPNDVLREVLPYMLDAKLVDSEEFEDCYCELGDDIKINGYAINDSGERLQLFVVDDDTLDLNVDNDELCVSQKKDYERQLDRAFRFARESFKGGLFEQVQEADPARILMAKLNSFDGFQQIDVVEIFLVSLTATVQRAGGVLQRRRMTFNNKDMDFKLKKENAAVLTKNVLFIYRVIDLNFLADAMVSRGQAETLVVDFRKEFQCAIPALKAVEQKNFSSYLCVFQASVLSDLYRRYSSRLLEKNVRSFLQFRGANRGMRETIKKEPEKFIAYNNGLTITATKLNGKWDKKAQAFLIDSLEDFQIVNGGQTTASIYFTNKAGIDISNVQVMAKINVAKTDKVAELDELISNISQFSNSQSRVSGVDLKARSQELVKLKQLSNSVMTPSGCKWFFERAKGEFNTSAKHHSNEKQFKKEYPNERRFSKEQLAKYYSAWGDIPHLVKKGGEKIFGHFISKISPDQQDDNAGLEKSPKQLVEINRDFYESLIAKIILFRCLEKIYGQGKNAMGQLRSAAIPYAMAIVYCHTDASANRQKFNMSKIWQNEGLDSVLEIFFQALLALVNLLIKDYSTSEDYGENAKKEELWLAIKECDEIKSFMTSKVAENMLDKYLVDE